MMRFRALPLASAIAFFVFAILFAVGLYAQAPGFTIKPLLQSTFGGDESKDAVVLAVEIAPGEFHGASHAPWRVLRDGF